jgi:D-psicose/D-tagatose/L-ribulose 3-epimerase
MGFRAFTIPVEEPALIDITAIREVLLEHPIRLHVTGAFSRTRDLTHDDVQYRSESLSYIESVLKICEELGVKAMVGPMYSAVGKRRHVPQAQRRREWERAVNGLQVAGRMALDHGVVLGIEPLNRFETDLVNTAAQAKQLIRDIDMTSVKIHLDTFHMYIEEKCMYEAIRLTGKDLVYVDASESDRGTPGCGQVQWREVQRALRAIDYRGGCVIESFTPACKTIADAAAIWRPLAASQDPLARDGREFLQNLFAGGERTETAATPDC